MSETLTYDNIFAGSQAPVVTGVETLLKGTAYVAGSVLGLITASGKLQLVDSTALDGSSTPYAILAEAVDATADDKTGVCYYSGEFDRAKLTFGGADDYDDHKVSARKLGMYFKANIN